MMLLSSELFPNMQTFLIATSALVAGLYLGSRLAKSPCPSFQFETLHPLPSDSKILSTTEDFSYSTQEYACNARSAYDYLSKLHITRVKLNDHRERGEANRARMGTITRKANAAEASENSFRSCLKIMMPQLLQEWDEKNKGRVVKLAEWDETKEEKFNGISFHELEELADEMSSL